MQQPPPRRGGSGQHPGAFTFEAKLEDEERLLDAMLAAMARAPLPEDWEKLHAAAQRDERLSELAFGFESVSQGKRLKLVPPAVAADFLFQAARFFGDVFGDELGAVTYLERALVLVPGHAARLRQDRAAPAEGRARPQAGRRLRGGRAAPAARRAGPAPQAQAAALLAERAGADDKVIDLLAARAAARAGRRGVARAPRGALRQGQPAARRGAPERAGARRRPPSRGVDEEEAPRAHRRALRGAAARARAGDAAHRAAPRHRPGQRGGAAGRAEAPRHQGPGRARGVGAGARRPRPSGRRRTSRAT